MGKVIQVTNHMGDKFNVRLVEQGDYYGLNDAVKHDNSKPMVIFYDDDGTRTFSEYGQQVSSYYLETLEEWYIEEEGGHYLSLDMGVPKWTVTKENIGEVVKAFGS